MADIVSKDRLLEEINLIPEDKLGELFYFIHYFRLGLEKASGNKEQIMKFAGCWEDMNEDIFKEFSEEKEKEEEKFCMEESS